VFFKPFRDEGGIVKFASITKDKNDYLTVTSNYPLTSGKFEKMVKTGKLLEPEVSGENALNHSSGNKSIAQKADDVKNTLSPDILDFISRAEGKIDDLKKITSQNAYGRKNKPRSLYRGVSTSDKVNGGGTGEGAGLYTTANKKLAAEYGKVLTMDADKHLPVNPLVFTNINQFEIWLQQVMYQGLGYKRVSEFGDIPINEVVHLIDPTVDGIQIGSGKKAFWVKYPSIDEFRDFKEAERRGETPTSTLLGVGALGAAVYASPFSNTRKEETK